MNFTYVLTIHIDFMTLSKSKKFFVILLTLSKSKKLFVILLTLKKSKKSCFTNFEQAKENNTLFAEAFLQRRDFSTMWGLYCTVLLKGLELVSR